METANRGDKFPTAEATSKLSVKTKARLPRKNRNAIKRENPMKKDVATTLTIANLARFALPAPSSLATLTLQQRF